MNPIDKALFHILQRCGLIAILRGVQPHEVVAIGHALYDAGFRIIEVPLNSPEPLASIRALRDALPADCLVGAGTVLSIEAVADVAAAGGQIIVMPHSDPDVIRAARAAGMACAPGVATLTEAYAALAAGANMLKLFPAEALPPMCSRRGAPSSRRPWRWCPWAASCPRALPLMRQQAPAALAWARPCTGPATRPPKSRTKPQRLRGRGRRPLAPRPPRPEPRPYSLQTTQHF